VLLLFCRVTRIPAYPAEWREDLFLSIQVFFLFRYSILCEGLHRPAESGSAAWAADGRCANACELMTRYFFHVHDGPFAHTDMVGEEFADGHAAWSEATRYAGEIIRDVDGRLQPDTEWRLDVTDQQGQPLYRIVVSTKLAS
jgi:hypothetical protein